MMLRATLGLLTIMLVQSGHSQTLATGDLEYYLQQALQAERPAARHALNHIGIQGQALADGFLITAILEDYPAHRAGLYRGDVILRADGEAFHPVFSFNSREQAPAGFAPRPAPVLLALQRGDQELEVSVSPVFETLLDSYRTATRNSVQQFPAGNKTVGYLRLWVVSRSTADLLAYQQLFGELRGSDGIILDLRDSVGFSDPAQLELLYRGASDSYQLSVAGDSDATAPDWLQIPVQTAPRSSTAPYRNPVALLINDRTRGGAELLAYQWDKLNRVISLGDGTAGQLGDWMPDVGQTGFEYRPASDLLVDDQSLEDQGYRPEREVPFPRQQTGRIDPQFQAAMDLLMGII
ncbi:MAG: hypothetical protein PsegKO_31980 [Pseudohongiellaceae bacterium]|jgi:C-terminal processing protease CtpA/Prc